MPLQYSPKNNPRVIIIQKLYGKFFNDDEKLDFPKHRFKKFIKDVVSGTIERNEILNEELDKNLGNELNFNNLDKLFQVILKSATYELLYKPNVSLKIIIKEYLNAFPKYNEVIQVGSASYYRRRTKKDSLINVNKSIAEQFNLLRICNNN